MPVRPASIVSAGLVVASVSAVTAVASATDEPRPPRAADGGTYVVSARVTDPDDTSGRLDIAAAHGWVRMGRDLRDRVHVDVRLRRVIDPSRLHRRHRAVMVELDLDGRPGAERELRIAAVEGEPVVDVISTSSRRIIAQLPVQQPRPTVLRVSGPRWLVGARRIFVASMFHRATHPLCGTDEGYPITCSDMAPQRGWLALPRPAWPDPVEPPSQA